METYWKPIEVSKNIADWYLVTENENREVVATHAKVHKMDGVWHWITQPPRLCFGRALSHDEARLAVEVALLGQSQTPEPPMINAEGAVIFSPWRSLELAPQVEPGGLS